MEHLSEALSKSMIKNLKKHDKYYVVWSRYLYDKYEPYRLTCSKHDKFYPELYVLSEKLMNKFEFEYKNAQFLVYRVKPSFGNIEKFKDEYEKGNITMDWENYNNIKELDLVYDTIKEE